MRKYKKAYFLLIVFISFFTCAQINILPRSKRYQSSKTTAQEDNSVSDCSINFISYLYDQTAPSSLTVSLAADTGTDTTPDISVAGIAPGDLVQVYSDNTCSTPAAPATRVDGITASITVNELTVGPHSFYAAATDPAGNKSACSAATTYTVENSIRG